MRSLFQEVGKYQKRTEVPVAVNVISKTTINETKGTRLDMVINKVPGVYMVDLGNEQHEMAVRQPLGTKNLVSLSRRRHSYSDGR